jgi:hypothetical protein
LVGAGEAGALGDGAAFENGEGAGRILAEAEELPFDGLAEANGVGEIAVTAEQREGLILRVAGREAADVGGEGSAEALLVGLGEAGELLGREALEHVERLGALAGGERRGDAVGVGLGATASEKGDGFGLAGGGQGAAEGRLQ